jgi:hypothetical protein
MMRFPVTPMCGTFFSLTLFLSCGGDRSGSPTCGMAQLIGPSLIQDRLRQLPFVLTDAPRGLPGTLPVRVVGTRQQSTVLVSYAKGALTMEHQGAGFPAGSVSDTTAYALLVVDDSTQRAQGVLIYESRRPPEGYPSIGALTGEDRTMPLYGVRVDWASVSNPKCPLLGAPPGPPSSAQ